MMSAAVADFLPLKLADQVVFRQEQDGYVLYYTPGYLVAAGWQAAGLVERGALAMAHDSPDDCVAQLRWHAEQAQTALGEFYNPVYRPVCLTLYLNNECNLDCAYCYSNPTSQPGLRLTLPEVRAAARLVAGNCHEQQLPFTLVLHGGGEPTLDLAFADQVLEVVEAVAAEAGLPMFRYIATNAVVSTRKAAWLADRFDLVGISCDGPEAIQSRQRSLRNGAGSSPFIERTAGVFRQQGKPFNVRVTLTPAIVERQAEIAVYICTRLKPEHIHVELVYTGGRIGSDDWGSHADAARFVKHFLEARRLAAGYGVGWSHAGSRLGELHGPYCHIFRQVLNLVPGGVATNCFKLVTAADVCLAGLELGHYDPLLDTFVLLDAQLEHLVRRPQFDLPDCPACFNHYHCVRLCPESCGYGPARPASHFRCQVQKLLAKASLAAFVEDGWIADLQPDQVKGRRLPASW